MFNVGVDVKFCSQKGDQRKIKKVDFQHLRALITPKTKLILTISPSNPDGKMWTQEEADELRKIMIEHPHINLFADEVYCRSVFDNHQYVPLARMTNMYDRTVTCFSMGKEFSCTGWRLGVGVGPKDLIEPMNEYTEISTGGAPELSQIAIGHALKAAKNPYNDAPDYFTWLRNDSQKRLDHLVETLQTSSKIDVEVIRPMGGYMLQFLFEKSLEKVPIKYFYPFIGVPFGEVRKKITSLDEFLTLKNPEVTPDEAFNSWIIETHKVAGIPGSAFCYNYSLPLQSYRGTDTIRFAACKSLQTMNKLRLNLM